VGSTDFYLDIRHRGRAFLEQRFPGIQAACLRRGVDIAQDVIPVFPCQHYLMGGVDVDLRSRSRVPGLYAAGECAHTGLHGGNRLASNSLPEALVFGRRAAEDILANEQSNEQLTMQRSCHDRREGNEQLSAPIAGQDILDPTIKEQIQQTMQEAAFVFPDSEKLPEAARQMRLLYEKLKGGKYQITKDYAEARSLACVAMLILEELLCCQTT